LPLKKIANRQEWDLTLTKMVNTGAVLSKKQRRQVLEYVVAKSAFQQKMLALPRAGALPGKEQGIPGMG